MDKLKLIDLLYDALPYVQKGEQYEAKEKGENPLLRRFVSTRIKEAIATLEKWEATCSQ